MFEGGEGRVHGIGVPEVVEADYRYVAGDAQFRLLNRRVALGGGVVVEVKNRRGMLRAGEQFPGEEIAPAGIGAFFGVVVAEHPVGPQGNIGFVQRLPITQKPIVSGLHIVFVDNGDSCMPPGEKVSGGVVSGLDIVDAYRGKLFVRYPPMGGHHRYIRIIENLQQRMIGTGLQIPRRFEDQSFHSLIDKTDHRGYLLIRRLPAAGQCQGVPGFIQCFFDTANDVRVDVAGEIEIDQADYSALVRLFGSPAVLEKGAAAVASFHQTVGFQFFESLPYGGSTHRHLFHQLEFRGEFLPVAILAIGKAIDE